MGKRAPWQEEMAQALREPGALAQRMGLEPGPIEAVSNRYPFRIPRSYLELCLENGQSLLPQVLPHPGELDETGGARDHLEEEATSPAPAVLRRYEDRVVLMVTHACAVACRFCNRKSRLSASPGPSWGDIQTGLVYISSRNEIRDVLLSGGDPLVLEDSKLAKLLESLWAMPHIEMVRVGSRVPIVLPSRITASLCRLLNGDLKPTWLVAHVNHPKELAPSEVGDALRRLARCGIPLLAQTVLLRGVNDSPEVLEELFWTLAANRVQPYYLFHAEPAQGTAPFQLSLGTGLSIVMEAFRRLPPEYRPTYVLDTKEGKRPLLKKDVTRSLLHVDPKLSE